MKLEIIQYIRKKNYEPVGVLLAQKHDNTIYIGWSKYASTKENINFSKRVALHIAEGRIEKYVKKHMEIEYHIQQLGNISDVESVTVQSQENTITLPFMVEDNMDKFISRCERYFKTDDIVIV